jgi:hypothetical protein
MSSGNGRNYTRMSEMFRGAVLAFWRRLLWISSVYPGRCQDSTLSYDRTSISFPIHYSLNNPTILCYIILATHSIIMKSTNK